VFEPRKQRFEMTELRQEAGEGDGDGPPRNDNKYKTDDDGGADITYPPPGPNMFLDYSSPIYAYGYGRETIRDTRNDGLVYQTGIC